MKKIHLAYLAGIIDGEGCVNISRITRNGKYEYKARFNVVSTDEILIDWLKNNFDGYKYTRTTHLQNHPTWKIKFEWHLCFKKDSLKMLYNLLPYLVIKGEQLKIVIAFLHTTLGRNGKLSDKIMQKREYLYNTLKSSKKPVAETK